MSEPLESSTSSQHAHVTGRDELSAWLAYAQQVTEIGVTAVQLFHAELRLALSSAKRLFIVAVLMLPVILLSWIALTVLISWFGYAMTSELLQRPEFAFGAAVLVFLMQQLLALYVMYRLVSQYRNNMRLSATRRHIQQIREGVQSGLRPTE